MPPTNRVVKLFDVTSPRSDQGALSMSGGAASDSNDDDDDGHIADRSEVNERYIFPPIWMLKSNDITNMILAHTNTDEGPRLFVAWLLL